MAAVTLLSVRAINIYYAVIGLILIGVGGGLKASDKLSSAAVTGGIVACGLFIFLCAVLGFISALRTGYPKLIVLYIILLAIIIILQFSISIALLSVTTSQMQDVLGYAWKNSADSTKINLQANGMCCGFNTLDPNDPLGPPAGSCSTGDTCYLLYESRLDYAYKTTGGVGLFFVSHYVIGLLMAHFLRKNILKGGDSNRGFHGMGDPEEGEEAAEPGAGGRGAQLQPVGGAAKRSDDDEEESGEESAPAPAPRAASVPMRAPAAASASAIPSVPTQLGRGGAPTPAAAPAPAPAPAPGRPATAPTRTLPALAPGAASPAPASAPARPPAPAPAPARPPAPAPAPARGPPPAPVEDTSSEGEANPFAD